ncbi:MAG: DNA polymerase IV [Crocinitomicaceae bacterium]|nr:DNA polymerase IV [Crocinitomicaceae bacterium]
MRKIIHIDMDAFYASVEQRDNPSLRGKPIAVGYCGPRGVVATASYEARKFGVRSAMASQLALKKCPQLIFMSPRFDVYKSVSYQIRDIFSEYTDMVEPLSLDEAYLDVTTNHKNIPYAMDIAMEIKERIYRETHLTASAGVSINKFLAKIASDYNKPNGIFIIGPKKAETFIEELSIENFFGIGKKTAERMHQMNIFTGKDLKNHSEEFLVHNFGNLGKVYYLNARAIDNRIVNPNKIRKSIGVEWTFETDTNEVSILENELELASTELTERIKKYSFKGKTLTLKVKYNDFTTLSRSKTKHENIDDFEDIYHLSKELLMQVPLDLKIRLIGISIKTNEKELEVDEIIENSVTQLEIPFKEDLG